jgi:citrate lyase subunit beta/citryl-CoA lyase
MTFAMGPALLFCPADRPDRFAKALERADAVIIDLEDAVAPENRASAREAVVANPLDPDRTIVRLNSSDTPDFALDLEALARTAYRTVMLAKAHSVSELDDLAGLDVIALCETAAGVLAAPALASAPNVVALMWGAEDLLASLGGSSSRRADGSYRDVARHARSATLLAAAAAGTAAIDAVFLDLSNRGGLAMEARDAAETGFAATACVHPSQVAVIRDAYRPSAEQLAGARAVLAAAGGEHGVFRFAGQMVDGPVLAHARRLVQRARD